MINIEYDFDVRMYRDIYNQYMVDMFEIGDTNDKALMKIPFVFDCGATYTVLNKDMAEMRKWNIFKREGVYLGSYITDGKYIVYDLRKIPKLIFGVKQIENLVVATPSDGRIKVSNLLGRSFIDNFGHGVDPDNGRIFFKHRNIIVDPEVSFGRMMNNNIKDLEYK